MFSNFEKMDALQRKKRALESKIQAIEKDLKSGLDPDSGEQAIQLQNYEVLLELLRTSEYELAKVNKKLNKLEYEMYG